MNKLKQPEELIQQLQARVVQLEQENRLLQSSESRYRKCFENAPISLVFASTTGEIKEMNAAAQKFLGWTIAQAKEANFNVLTDSTLIENGTATSVQRAIAGETVIELPIFFDPSSTIGQGQWKWAQGHYYPIRDEAGEVQEIVEIALDLTPMYEVQQRLAQERERAIQEKLAELEAQNRLLENRDRLLEATAMATNALLTIENLDEAVKKALQIIGECLDTDRVCVIENFTHPSDSSFLWWRILYEWNSPYAVSQTSHPQAAQGTYEGLEDWYEQLVRGQSVSYLLEEIPEPFRTGQAAISVKALHGVPIFVEGKFFGIAGFDDCREAKHRDSAELAILKTAAACIGSAIQHQRSQKALLQAEQARSAQLKKVNEVLKQTVDVLATETEFDHFLGHVLQVIAVQLNAPLTEYWYHPEPNNVAYVGLTCWQGQILTPKEQPGHIGLFGYPVPPEMIHQESLHHRRSHFILEDLATNALHVQIASDYGLDAGAWYGSRGVSRLLNVPLILGDQTIGALIIFLPRDRHFTEEDIKLTYALAQQVTLAVQLTRLAEEAKQTAILEERNRMARDIHDALAQSLTGVVMQLNAATEFLDNQPQQAIACITRAQDLAKQGLAEARRSVWLLYQSDANACGLSDAITRLVEQMTLTG